MSFLSPVHIVFFAAIALLALGPKRFPEFTRTLGHAVRELREVMHGVPGLHDVVGDGGSQAQADATVEAAAPLSVAAGAATAAAPPAPEPLPLAAGEVAVAPPPAS
jgi:Sec-independent protein translocase protein TatA